MGFYEPTIWLKFDFDYEFVPQPAPLLIIQIVDSTLICLLCALLIKTDIIVYLVSSRVLLMLCQKS